MDSTSRLPGRGSCRSGQRPLRTHRIRTFLYAPLGSPGALPYGCDPPSGEAAYVIDGLLYHEADLSIGTHHTDGGAVSNFALAYMLGFYFAPRIPNLAERRSTPLDQQARGRYSNRSSPGAWTKS